jgi:hypothetical protein
MKNIISLALSLMLCLFVTASESNAAMQSQQDNKSISFNDGLPNYTVNTNTMDSEEPVLLARRWGHYRRKHICLRKRNPRYRYTYRSRWCKSYRARKAAKARAHYRKLVVRYHKRKAHLRRVAVCNLGPRILNKRGNRVKRTRCYNPPPWRTGKGKQLQRQGRRR